MVPEFLGMRKLFLLLFLLTLPAFAGPELPAPLAIYFNGEAGVAVGGLLSEGRLLVDAEGIAKVLHAPFVDEGEQGRVVVNSTPVGKARKVQGITYVDVVELLVTLGLKGEIKEDGKVLEVWTPQALANRIQLNLSLTKVEKLTSPFPGEETLVYTLQVRNLGQRSTSVNGDHIYLLDSDNGVYACASDFEATLNGRETKTVGGVLFNVPRGKSPKFLLLMMNDQEVARLRL